MQAALHRNRMEVVPGTAKIERWPADSGGC